MSERDVLALEKMLREWWKNSDDGFVLGHAHLFAENLQKENFKDAAYHASRLPMKLVNLILNTGE